MILISKTINKHILTNEALDTTRVAVVLHVRTKLHHVLNFVHIRNCNFGRVVKAVALGAILARGVGSNPTGCILNFNT